MFDDKQLQHNVLEELTWEPSVNATDIGVTAKAGVITLMGYVTSYTEKVAAESAARRVKGVKGIAEELEVRLPFSARYDDEELAVAAVAQLKWDSAVPSDAVVVKVENGYITLTGEVDWHYQQVAATSDVSKIRGVIGLSNNITIRPKQDTSKIRNDIIVALHRSWFDPATIDVTAEDGKVTLAGNVESWYEREEASSAAWAAPGTTSVENNIVIV